MSTRSLTVGVVLGVKRLLYVSAGWWNADGMAGFQIADRATKYAKGDTTKGDKRFTIMRLVATSRALIFMPVPAVC